MWFCKQCNEENEDNFDCCWNCQSFSDKSAEKDTKNQKKLIKKEKKILEEDNNKNWKDYSKDDPLKLILIILCIFSFIGVVYWMYNVPNREYRTTAYMFTYIFLTCITLITLKSKN